MRPECEAAASAYRLALPSMPASGRAGERLGKATGSSLEFMDFRDYAPGDDLRHVDWRTYARTDQLKVRLFREEISPAVDIVCDLSPSMAVTDEKQRAARDLVSAFGLWAKASAGAPRVFASGGTLVHDIEQVSFDGGDNNLVPLQPLRARSLRVLISDFLFPVDPRPMIRRLASNASHLWVVQLLDPWEIDPDRAGTITLVDCEDDSQLDINLDAARIASYKQRLQRLVDAAISAVRGIGGTWAQLSADEPAAMFRHGLLAQGIVEPA